MAAAAAAEYLNVPRYLVTQGLPSTCAIVADCIVSWLLCSNLPSTWSVELFTAVSVFLFTVSVYSSLTVSFIWLWLLLDFFEWQLTIFQMQWPWLAFCAHLVWSNILRQATYFSCEPVSLSSFSQMRRIMPLKSTELIESIYWRRAELEIEVIRTAELAVKFQATLLFGLRLPNKWFD